MIIGIAAGLLLFITGYTLGFYRRTMNRDDVHRLADLSNKMIDTANSLQRTQKDVRLIFDFLIVQEVTPSPRLELKK